MLMDNEKVLHDLKYIAQAMNNVKDAMVFLTNSIDTLYKDLEIRYENDNSKPSKPDRE